ncbi:MAG: hypothetical protein L0220_26390, partial [Acidobacteria bacterium]|nr:hypothetical protein [Acidobacteriota bacterium]
MDVPNGRYYIVVERENTELARVDVQIMELSKTEVRRDIEFQWKGQPGEPTGKISVDSLYTRSAENQKLFD